MNVKSCSVLFIIMVFFLVGCEIGPHQRYIASQIEGHILNNKKPIIGATIIREIAKQGTDKTWTQETKSDANGYFKLDEITEKGYLKILGTTVYHLNLRITHQNKTCFERKWVLHNASLKFGEWYEAKDILTKENSKLTFRYDVAQ